MEWEILMTAQVEAFLDALFETDRDGHRLVNQAILAVERTGPAEGRPLVDTVTASRLPNMKELRPPSAGRTEIRILFVFECATRRCQYRMGVGDPRRRAVVAAG